MKIGIIGCSGFVGSAFQKVFSDDGKTSVTGISRSNSKQMKGHEFDILINANGNSSKRLSDADPKADFEMNVAATLGFLQDIPCKHYMHISTVEVYNDKSSKGATREDIEIDPIALSNYGFSKYCGELVAKKYAKSWMILRLAGMVGPNMKKGPAYDIMESGKLYVSSKSRYQFINTEDVARIAKALCEKGKWGQVYNVAGRGSMPLSMFATMAGVKLKGEGSTIQVFDISTGKIEAEAGIPSTEDAVRDFLAKGAGNGK